MSIIATMHCVTGRHLFTSTWEILSERPILQFHNVSLDEILQLESQIPRGVVAIAMCASTKSLTGQPSSG